MITGAYESEKRIQFFGIDKRHLKCNCINGSIVNGVREPILFSFGLTSPPGHKINKELRIKFFENINNFVVSHIIFYLGDNDHKAVKINGETITFTCQLIKM